MKGILFNLSVVLIFGVSVGELWAGPGNVSKKQEAHGHMKEMDHSQMMMDSSYHGASKSPIKTLNEVPASGKARENGFDGRSQMEPTGIENPLATKCAQASRGLIMMSNRDWEKCGGKVKGIPEGPGKNAKKMDHGSMGHGNMSEADHGGAHWASPPDEQNRPNPVKQTHASIERGEKLFQTHCTSCHGADARGNTPTAKALNPPPADLVVMSGQHPDGDFFWKITNGRGAMPAWKTVLNEKQRWDLVNFIQNLGKDRDEDDDHGHRGGGHH